MKIQFKHQGFQRDAARAVVDVFRGQPLRDAFAYRMDAGKGRLQLETQGFRNHDILLSDEELTRNIREIQTGQDLKPIDRVRTLQALWLDEVYHRCAECGDSRGCHQES